MNSQPLVSVITPTYGRATQLEDAIESVLRQSYASVELIVVDDNEKGSEYRLETEQCMKKYKNDHRVLYLKNDYNIGASASRNRGAQAAKGSILAFLDDDDYYLPTYIERMVERLFETEADMVYMDMAFCDDGKHIYAHKRRPQYPEGVIHTAVLEGVCPICIFFMLQKSVFEAVGGFDETLRDFDECDVWMKIAKSDYKIYCVAESLAVYRRDQQTRITENPQKRLLGLARYVEKWEKKLSVEDMILFSVFKQNHLKECYSKMCISKCFTIKERVTAFKLYKEVEVIPRERLRVLLNLFLSDRLPNLMWYYKYNIRKHYVILGEIG